MKYTIIIENEKKDKRNIYELNIEELRAKNDVADELLIKSDKTITITRNIGYYQGETYILDKPVKVTYNFEELQLFEGINYIYILDEGRILISAEYVLKNVYGEYFASQFELDSKITQTSSSITQEVTGKIQGLEKELNGKIELKVNTKDLVSELNASADIIRLTSNRIIIESDYFKLTEDGMISATSGTIGGFTLDSQKFSSNFNGLYDFSIEDVEVVLNAARENIHLSNFEKKLYDLNNDNEVDIVDAVMILNIVHGNLENTKTAKGSVKIDSNNPKKVISIYNEDNEITTSIGVVGIDANILNAKSILVTAKDGSNDGIKLNGFSKQLSLSNNDDSTVLTPTSVTSKAFNNNSLLELKKNINKIEDVSNIILNSNIYEFNYKGEDDNYKKHYGFIIGEGYKTPCEVMNNDKNSIDLYSMCSLLWKHNQELEERIKKLEEKQEAKI